MSAIQERLKKLHQLAMRGVDGEREQAQALFDKLSQKYGVQLEDLEEEKLGMYKFKYKDHAEETILIQISYMVTNRTDNIYSYKDGRRNRNCQLIECSESQNAEIEFLFEFYKELWKRECTVFLEAFIQKHDLFGDPENCTNTRKFSNKDLMKMAALMAGMEDASPLRQIEAAKKGE